MIRTPQDDFLESLKDPEYLNLYGAADATNEIGILFTKARLTIGKSRKEIASAAGLSQQYYAGLERGEANPTIGKIGSLLAVIGFRLVANTKPLKPKLAKRNREKEV